MDRLSEKGRGIRDMFDRIAPRYDLLNRVLSIGIDRYWRRFAVAQLRVPEHGLVLDIATGTSDVALEVAKQTPDTVKVVGADFTQGMLLLGQRKIAASKYSDRIFLVNSPCESIPHPNGTFDGVTIAFGIRNVVDRQRGLEEMARVLKPGGRVAILEFAEPRNRIFRAAYYFYFLHILPWLGGLLSQRSAYEYLPDSVLRFPDRQTFKKMMQEAGFRDITIHDLTGGIVTVSVGTRRQKETEE
ncbi:MAG: bifunctional demethylmenaquinone methyltransferase/2-methoxy-6-polyprenyl-1,4-benzoquinol methylase UbiE [Deltaproteobacteria bacterium]|nr:bifunctional demethylmenaquinone methyltransferase/2-methoxy-6-polyprenyl-1,4-benzoquinol methylase UbiE [Deltaproteobacteria bacterium]MBW2476586.1 bifunctional demethylmenaquinone methyltransferase/2-methoxy-6-polyprenyl-1,4-benzoquinol methylase UbiE [Deltaproteobacteria bacterium]MBW2503991.1 bifunctional demethylmenaquinone methyltransferase/2-methoxy-6-polyprenyl-1,4-benzoquinol methylase UbiE [Deltaproteobacteria bacterium]